MLIDDVVLIGREALIMIIKLSAPVLIVSMVVGLVVSIFQTATSIQEQTLTFVPKIISCFLTLIIVGYWMLTEISNYIIRLWDGFAAYIR